MVEKTEQENTTKEANLHKDEVTGEMVSKTELKKRIKMREKKLRLPQRKQNKKRKRLNKLQLKVKLEPSLVLVTRMLILPNTLTTEKLGFKHNVMLTRILTLTSSTELTSLINL
jgi:hypothetical protein